MKFFIYKRTHKHDPNDKGVFGIQDCMGRMRNGKYDVKDKESKLWNT